eukprot:TRINITY_DN37440_c0_g1_i1.p1 TRINITY_DN37440_c0_g1~~TRINITY_DN37440_c0_g1_i1.p1  ORF type:complete len:201 (+),score=31.24 TRINITY_DN37440_c0_g1_i1:63-605(+)
MAFARSLIMHSLDGNNAIYYSAVFSTLEERCDTEEGEGELSHQDKMTYVKAIVEQVLSDATQKQRYGDQVGEGVISQLGSMSEEDEGLYIIWKQLKGCCFTLVVSESSDLLIATQMLSTLLKLLQHFYGCKPTEFESKDLLMRPEIAHAVVTKTFPAGFVPILDILVLRQSIKKVIDGLK